MVLMALFVSSVSVGAEKYYTWVDEQGRIHHTVIPEEKNPLIVDKQDVLTKEDGVKPEPSIKGSAPEPTLIEPIIVKPDETANTFSSLPDPEQVPVTKSVEINEEDYIDGNVLEQQGNIRSEDDLPYYTWTDEQGVLRTTPYRPASEKLDNSKKQKITKKTSIPLRYTVAEEYYRISEPVSAEAVSKVDDFAQKLFFQESDFISSFSSKCCEDLPKTNPYEINFKNSIYIEINKKTENYVFSEGKS